MATAAGYIVLTTFCTGCAAVLSLTAIASPEWHVVDAPGYHMRRGFFQECQVSSPHKKDCNPIVSPREEFCGHKEELLEHRHGWSATFAIMACLGWMVAAILPVIGWCRYSLLTVPALLANLGSIFCLSISISIFVNTYEGWYYCELEYCDYAQFYLGVSEECFNTRGYSFTCAVLALVCGYMGAFVSALLVRATRSEKVDHQGNAITKESKVMAARLAALAEIEFEQDQEARRIHQAEILQQQEKERILKALPGDSQSPHRDEQGENLPSKKKNSKKRNESADSSGGLPPGPQNRRGQDWTMADKDMPPSLPPVGGDWVWNPETRLFWSNKEYLYLDPEQKRYYDPKACQWYDPKTDEWTQD